MERVPVRFDWLQFAALLLAMVSIALYNEGQLSKIEQRMIDSEEEHRALVQHLEKLEATWEAFPHPCSPSPTMR